MDDRALFYGVPDDLEPGIRGDVESVLRQGFVAGAVVDDRLVSVAHTIAITARYADIGVFTHEDYRNRGYSSAAAAIVAKAIRESGRTPVWSCGEDNLASLRVAAKAGLQRGIPQDIRHPLQQGEILTSAKPLRGDRESTGIGGFDGLTRCRETVRLHLTPVQYTNSPMS